MVKFCFLGRSCDWGNSFVEWCLLNYRQTRIGQVGDFIEYYYGKYQKTAY